GVRPGGLVDENLADRRADGAEFEVVPVQQRLELVDLVVRQGQDVGAQDRTKLNVADATRAEHVQLHLRVGADLIGEGGQGEHGTAPWFVLIIVNDGQFHFIDHKRLFAVPGEADLDAPQ